MSDMKHSQRAFTLIETLIVLVILGLMMPLLYAMIQTGSKAWTNGQSHATSTQRVLKIQNYLRRQLSQVYPLYLTKPNTRFSRQSYDVETKMFYNLNSVYDPRVND